MRARTAVAALAATLLCAALAAAEDTSDKLSLGLSYLATTGNSSSQTGGIDLQYRHTFDPWGLEANVNWLRAEDHGVVTAKKLYAGVRGTRKLGDDLGLFVSASALQDTFAGLDPRVLLAGGVTYKFLKGPDHELAFDGGLTWTRDTLVGDGSTSYVGGIAAARYGWNITKTSKFTENFAFYPSFKQGSDWRIESTTGLQAAVSSTVALKLAYAFRYANRPVAGFRKTDTQTTASLVVNLLK